MEIQELVRCCHNYRAIQIDGEFAWLLEKVLQLQNRKIAVEIGVMFGGTLYAFTKLFDRAIGIDISENELSYDLKEPHEYIIGNSKDPRILSRVKEDIDFLFIDGDHSYEGVSRDFELWYPKVRKGGLVALHDIRGVNIEGIDGVKDFWNEIKNKYRTEEIMAHEKFYGIGIIWV